MTEMNLKTKLIDSISRKRFPQTVLFYGPDQKYISNIVYSIAFSLILPKRDIDNERFARLISSNSYPDFIAVEKGEKGSIKIEEIQALDDIICYKPYESENRIVFIDDGGSMTLPAQNSLLKKIEEPPERTFFIISVKKKNSVLPTIASRSVAFFATEAKFESEYLTPFDYFPFLNDFIEVFGHDHMLAEMKKAEITVNGINLESLTNNNTVSEMISDLSSFDSTLNEYSKRAYIRMKLAFFAFYIKNIRPDVSMKIAEFLKNQQYFSPDASVFFNIAGEEIGKEQ